MATRTPAQPTHGAPSKTSERLEVWAQLDTHGRYLCAGSVEVSGAPGFAEVTIDVRLTDTATKRLTLPVQALALGGQPRRVIIAEVSDVPTLSTLRSYRPPESAPQVRPPGATLH
jgi:hypothetical protein